MSPAQTPTELWPLLYPTDSQGRPEPHGGACMTLPQGINWTLETVTNKVMAVTKEPPPVKCVVSGERVLIVKYPVSVEYDTRAYITTDLGLIQGFQIPEPVPPAEYEVINQWDDATAVPPVRHVTLWRKQ